ncbi:hypothetical protein TSMG0169 [Halocynthia phage JM-2012]|uniref:hypothetical protein n=1 Tax=Halocynthia phage JM-2012 TaxID=1173297 RepID=UPI00025C698B|nr:hypothetical protein TSMG0169 [Halocynthia phage JM-2012]AFI55452.1 hypothetical protein TSMG0169 [Halocynthia phage JM-2012]
MAKLALDILKNTIPQSNCKIKEVWMDADGCLVDWEGYVAKRLHLFSDIFHIKDFRANIPILNSMDKVEREVLIKKYYRRFPDTFLNLDITTECFHLIEIMKYLDSKDIPVKILTSLDNKHHDLDTAKTHKLLNLTGHLNQFGVNYDIEVVTTHSDKTQYAKHGGLLIDDYHRNVSTFIDKGGMGICHKDPNKTIMELVDLLKA